MNPIFIIIFKIFKNNLNSNYFYQEKTDRYGGQRKCLTDFRIPIYIYKPGFQRNQKNILIKKSEKRSFLESKKKNWI